MSAVARGAALWTWAMLTFLNVPIAVIAVMSFSSGDFLGFPPPGFSSRWYQAALTSPRWIDAAIVSFQIALAATLIATPLGIAASFGLVRGRFRGRLLLMQLANAPLAVPSIIAAVGFYFFFARLGLVGTRLAIMLAHTALSVPLVVVNVTAGVRELDAALENAARNLGATRRQTFWHVTLPMLRPAIMNGALFAFLLSFDELIVALFVGGAGTTTLPMRMWTSLRDELDPTIAAISTLLVALSALVILGAGAVGKRSRQDTTA